MDNNCGEDQTEYSRPSRRSVFSLPPSRVQLQTCFTTQVKFNCGLTERPSSMFQVLCYEKMKLRISKACTSRHSLEVGILFGPIGPSESQWLSFFQETNPTGRRQKIKRHGLQTSREQLFNETNKCCSLEWTNVWICTSMSYSSNA